MKISFSILPSSMVTCLSNISGLSSGVPTIKHILDYCLSNISGLSSGVPTIKHILIYQL